MRILDLFKSDSVWAGWLYGDPSDIPYFQALGVHGPMIWRVDSGSMDKSGVIEKCLCDDATLKKLVSHFNPGVTIPEGKDWRKAEPARAFSPYSYKRAKEEWGWER